MTFTRKAVIAAFTFAIVLMMSGAELYAAQGSGKLKVPAGILKGSSVQGKRKFYRTSIPENTLAKIRLGRKANEVLYIWGNPTRITIGASRVSGGGGAAGGAGMMGGPRMAGGAGMMGGPGGMAGGPTMPGGPGMMGGAAMGPGGLPGMGGMNAPGMGGIGLPGMGGRAGAGVAGMGGRGAMGRAGGGAGLNVVGGGAQEVSSDEVTWTYDLTNGITLEFVITEGIVTQITVGGVGPWSLSKTRTGIQLGDTYKLALWIYGYPESQSYSGRFLRVSYVNKNRVLLTVMDKKIVGVTIAMIPDQLAL